jgi:hypothetical protein
MPNSQNRSKDQSNIVKPKKRSTKASASNAEPQMDKKQGKASTSNPKNSSKAPNPGS